MIKPMDGGIYISAVNKGVMIAFLIMAIMLSVVFASNLVNAASEPNLALNPSQTGYPEATASYTCGCDNVWSAVNGTFYFKGNEPRDRWTSYYTGSETDWLAIDFGSPTTFNQAKLYYYNDGGGVIPPASYLVQYWNGNSWVEAANQTKTPETPTAAVDNVATPENTLNIVNFDTVTSTKLRIVFTNTSGYATGLVELEVFLHQSADQIAASAMVAQIEQLPIQGAVLLTDKPAIVAARTAFDNLTVNQKNLVTNLSKLTAAEAAIAALEAAVADQIAASAMIAQIEQLPIRGAVVLTDKPAIIAARTAYTNLTVSQKSLVTNLSKLTAAEAAIVTLETALIPGVKNVGILSAFGNAEGNTITLKLSSVLDVTYSMQADKFQVIVNAAPIPVTHAVYDSTDPSHQTIKLTFSSPVLLNETLVTFSSQSGAFKTSNNEFNNAIPSRPVITFKAFDLTLDNHIGVDDIVRMMSSPAMQNDVNQDGIFNREDLFMLLSQISVR